MWRSYFNSSMSTSGCEPRLCAVNLLGQEGLTTLALIQGDTQPSNLLSAQFRRTMEFSTHQYSSSLLSALRLVKPTDEVESPKYLQKQDRHLQCLKTLPKNLSFPLFEKIYRRGPSLCSVLQLSSILPCYYESRWAKKTGKPHLQYHSKELAIGMEEAFWAGMHCLSHKTLNDVQVHLLQQPL